jgi:hypothetical protein
VAVHGVGGADTVGQQVGMVRWRGCGTRGVGVVEGMGSGLGWALECAGRRVLRRVGDEL